MTGNDDSYRAKAAETQREADHASKIAAWLRMVQGWLALIKNQTRSDDIKE
ncbi:hypothetical protein [Bradyrhizobium sp. OAE829]|uniref:hypothetical protein n=1 Tax=Bradyrhizobium sp. OAE829 TaxID=2663807 RepID=UPI00178B5082